MNRYLIHVIVFLSWTICQFSSVFASTNESIELFYKMIEIVPSKQIRIMSTAPYKEFDQKHPYRKC